MIPINSVVTVDLWPFDVATVDRNVDMAEPSSREHLMQSNSDSTCSSICEYLSVLACPPMQLSAVCTPQGKWYLRKPTLNFANVAASHKVRGRKLGRVACRHHK